MNSIIFPTICLNNSGKITELWIKCTVWRTGSCAARGYSLALMMSGDGGRAEGEVVSFTVIFSRIKNTLLKQQGGPVNRGRPERTENVKFCKKSGECPDSHCHQEEISVGSFYAKTKFLMWVKSSCDFFTLSFIQQLEVLLVYKMILCCIIIIMSSLFVPTCC